MTDEEEFCEKIESFLEDKQKLSLEACYFLVKLLEERYWERIRDFSEASDDDFVDEDDSADFSDEQYEPTPDEEVPKPSKQVVEGFSHKDKVKSLFKKPIVKIKGQEAVDKGEF